MNPLRCCVIDDEPLAANLISSYVERTPTLALVGTFNSASEAVRVILDGKVDLVFLDIEMPQINGMEFAKIIPPTCRIIFTTAYDRYAVQGFRVNAIDYLLKPVSYEEFLEAANRALSAAHGAPLGSNTMPSREFLLVKSEYRLIQIRIADIQLIEGLKDYIKIFVAGQPKAILTLMSMKAIEQTLPARQFMRVHRSYIVNTSKISIIERNHIIIGDHVVPVSESYRQQFSDYIASLNPDNE
ncbi:MAG: LytTR family DNA-binding domain-containing protein [Bacteroidales bacterium]|nr:LytTR family DNA-binding domain-containing protein [Bacteroidales bacterium]